MKRFGDTGPALHRAGWDIVPVKTKTKRALEDEWQHGFTIERIEKWALNGYANGSIGLLARRFPGGDIDVSDETCAAAIEVLMLRTLGPAPVRVGSWPKRLLVYSTSAPFKKVKIFLTGPDGDKGPDGKDYAIEFLGDGQQYLIYGEHPDGFEYRWPQGGGPGDSDIWDLTEITRDSVAAFEAALPAALPAGWSVRSRTGGADSSADGLFENYKAPLDGWDDLAKVEAEILPHLDPDCDYEEWLKVGAALHHQSGGDPDWLAAWDAWSVGSGKYAEGLCERKWESFTANRSSASVTLASLLHMTKAPRAVDSGVKAASFMERIVAEIAAALTGRTVELDIAPQVAAEQSLGDSERSEVAALMRARLRALGAPVEMSDIRRWLRPRPAAGETFPDLTEDGFPLCTLENLGVLLHQLDVTVRYNVISKQTEVLVPGSSYTRDNKDNVSVSFILSESERVRMPTKFTQQFLLSVGDANLHNPVMQWIESKEWDGVSRLADFYATALTDKAEISDTLKHMLMRKWLLQAVAAASSEDGIAGQGVLTFTGAQNQGKTTWFKNLAPRELDLTLSGHTLDVKSKDSQLTALKHWIVELGEIDATFRKSDISALKSWVNQSVDNIRRPYAATESCYGRRTVFGASVNDEQFLADKTGNRRFWVIPVTGFQFDHGVNMQQVWAEVWAILQAAGEAARWNLNPEELELLNAHNEGFTVSDPVEETLWGHWDWEKEPSDWVWLTATDALKLAGRRDPTRNDAIVASTALRKLNGGKRRKSHGRVLFAVPAQNNNDFLG